MNADLHSENPRVETWVVKCAHGHRCEAGEQLIAERDAEIERLRGLLAPELTVKDLEIKIRDGQAILTATPGEETRQAMKLLAALMLNFVLGEDNEEPDNYRSAEVEVRPGGERPMRAYVEIIKPGGRTSHEIRRDLEAQLERSAFTRPAVLRGLPASLPRVEARPGVSAPQGTPGSTDTQGDPT